MKKYYTTPLVALINYNHVDIVTTSVFGEYSHVKDSWLGADWLN